MIGTVEWFKFGVAVWLACFLHRKQTRKILQTPYISHPLIVSGLVFEMGGSIQAAIAAALHDIYEDIGGKWVRAIVIILFGKKTSNLIDEVSKDRSLPKEQQKVQQVEKVRNNRMSIDALVLKMADLLHNSKSIRAEIDRRGPEVFCHFNGGYKKIIWYFQAMCEAYTANDHAHEFRYRIGELKGVIEDIETKIQ